MTTSTNEQPRAATNSKPELYYLPEDYEARWVFGGGKGGTVKTTSAVHSGIICARTGKTLLVDADPRSQSAQRWSVTYQQTTQKEPPFTVIQWTTDGLAEGVRRLVREGGFKHVLIDVGGETERLYRQALRLADELILPITPSGIELVTLNASLAAAEEVAAEQEREIGAQVLFARSDRRTDELKDAIALAEHYEWPYLDTVIPYQKRYRCFGNFPADAGEYENAAPEVVGS